MRNRELIQELPTHFPPTLEQLKNNRKAYYIADEALSFSQDVRPLVAPHYRLNSGVLSFFRAKHLEGETWINLAEVFMVVVLSRSMFNMFGGEMHREFRQVIFQIEDTQTFNLTTEWVNGSEFEECFIYPLSNPEQVHSVMVPTGFKFGYL